jgi:hypothetical protein
MLGFSAHIDSIDYVLGSGMGARQRHCITHAQHFSHIRPVARSISVTGSGSIAHASVSNLSYIVLIQ